MKILRCVTSTAAALHEVFSINTCSARPFSLCCARFSPLRAQFLRRSLSSTGNRSLRKAEQYGPQSRKQGPPQNENIRAFEVQVVDEDNSLKPPVPLFDVLDTLDRKLYTLVQVSPPESDGIPVCKIYNREALRQAERARIKPPKDPISLTKQLELNWAIDPNDLRHRLNKMQEFLEQGRRVEVILAAKRKGRKATEEEAQSLLQRLRDRAKELDGAKEWKDMQGKVLGQASLFFEGKAKN